MPHDCDPEHTRPPESAGGLIRIGLAMFAIGYGADLFAPMLEVYRSMNGTGSSVTAMFGVYAAGLVPALIIFGPIPTAAAAARCCGPR